MVCSSGYFESTPAQEEAREKRTAKKRDRAKDKMVSFFASHGHLVDVKEALDVLEDPKRIEVIVQGEVLNIYHRKVHYCAPTWENAESLFRSWCREHMTHARVWKRT